MTKAYSTLFSKKAKIKETLRTINLLVSKKFAQTTRSFVRRKEREDFCRPLFLFDEAQKAFLKFRHALLFNIKNAALHVLTIFETLFTKTIDFFELT